LIRMRLTRTGKKRYATWRIVVADSRRHVTAKVIEYLGWYNPHSKEFKVDEAKVKSWFDKGAQPSNSLAILFERHKIKMPEWVEIKRVEPKEKEEKEVKEEKPVKAEEAATGKVPETKTEEVTAEAEEVTSEEVTEATEAPEEEKEEKTEEAEEKSKEAK